MSKLHAILDMAQSCGFDTGTANLHALELCVFFDAVVAQCAQAAAVQARHYSGSGHAGDGCLQAAQAVLGYGEQIGTDQSVKLVIGPERY